VQFTDRGAGPLFLVRRWIGYIPIGLGVGTGGSGIDLRKGLVALGSMLMVVARRIVSLLGRSMLAP
jgi:hypothetical protein